MKAYQIVNFDNPLSMAYAQMSVSSFHCVKDVLEIEQVQCITPDTLLDLNLSKEKKRTPTECAALMSHYVLAQLRAKGEEFIVLEHDAFLKPGMENQFRLMLTKTKTRSAWMPGIAAECYTMFKEVAELFCYSVKNDNTHSHRGPVGMLHNAGMLYARTHKTRVIWPLYGETAKSVYGDTINLASKGKGIIVDSPVTQYVDLQAGVTIKREWNKHIGPKNNPNMWFGSLGGICGND